MAQTLIVAMIYFDADAQPLLQNNFKTYYIIWISQEISILEYFGEGQNISYVIWTTRRFQYQQLVVPIKKGAQFFKEYLSYYFSYSVIGPGFSQQ